MKRALIVDDDRCIREFLVIWIEYTGIFDVVDYAFDGEDALDFFYKHKYDLIILDLGLLAMNGIDVCIEMRKKDKDVTIVTLTGYPEIIEKYDLTVAGFNKIYLKPEGFKQMVKDIEEGII